MGRRMRRASKHVAEEMSSMTCDAMLCCASTRRVCVDIQSSTVVSWIHSIGKVNETACCRKEHTRLCHDHHGIQLHW